MQTLHTDIWHLSCCMLQGCKVFCLQYVSVATIDVPQSSSMNRYLDKGDVESAYKVACLGVTDSDWKTLALAALQVRLISCCVSVNCGCGGKTMHLCSTEPAVGDRQVLGISMLALGWGSAGTAIGTADCKLQSCATQHHKTAESS